MNLCTFGLHKWPRWTKKRAFTKLVGDGIQDDTLAVQQRLDNSPRHYKVRICKRKGCKARQERPV